MSKLGDLKVWWIPQVPMKSFDVQVYSLTESKLVLKTLADYDLFQLENNIKPDFSNAGGLSVFEDGEWIDWYDEVTGDSIDDLTDEDVKGR